LSPFTAIPGGFSGPRLRRDRGPWKEVPSAVSHSLEGGVHLSNGSICPGHRPP